MSTFRLLFALAVTIPPALSCLHAGNPTRAEANTLDLLAPGKPSGVHVVSFDGRSARIAWIDPDDRESTFVVEKSIDGIRWVHAISTSADTTRCIVNHLQRSNVWYFRVRGRDALGGHSPVSRPTVVTNHPDSR